MELFLKFRYQNAKDAQKQQESRNVCCCQFFRKLYMIMFGIVALSLATAFEADIPYRRYARAGSFTCDSTPC